MCRSANTSSTKHVPMLSRRAKNWTRWKILSAICGRYASLYVCLSTHCACCMSSRYTTHERVDSFPQIHTYKHKCNLTFVYVSICIQHTYIHTYIHTYVYIYNIMQTGDVKLCHSSVAPYPRITCTIEAFAWQQSLSACIFPVFSDVFSPRLVGLCRSWIKVWLSKRA